MQAPYFKLSLALLSVFMGFTSIGYADYEGTYPTVPETPIETIADGDDCCRTGIWLPEDPLLFKPFVADPRQIVFSGGWRFNDNALVKNTIDVSFGDYFVIYRWMDVGPWHGQLEIDIEGCLWACFDPLHFSSPLMNADYYGGSSLSYAFGSWSFRLRGYHISSHIGDEFLINHKHDHNFKRKNPSAEYVDLFASYYPTDEIRLYGGLGVVVGCDESFRIGRFYAEAGAELHMSQLGFTDVCDQVYGRPFYGMHFHYQTKHEKHVNQTYVLGYEWGKLVGLQRVFRAFIEYHDGYSVEGQFFRKNTNYFSMRISYGF